MKTTIKKLMAIASTGRIAASLLLALALALPAAANVAKNTTTGTEYATVQAAITEASNGQTVQMLADSTESVTVASGKDLTLDLAGFALKGTSSARIVTIEAGATLAVTDSVPTAVHNFKVGTDGLWTLTEDAASVNYEDLTARPAANTVIALKGGALTGGSSAFGGGVYCNEGGRFTLACGNIVGNLNNSGSPYKTVDDAT